MSWSQVTVLEEDIAFTGGVARNAPTANFATLKNTEDSEGAFELVFSGQPGTVTGDVALQGRLSADAPWADVFVGGSRVELTGTGGSLWTILFGAGQPNGVIKTQIPNLPFIRVRFDGYTLTNSRTVTVRHLE